MLKRDWCYQTNVDRNIQASAFLSSFLERNATLPEQAKIDLCWQVGDDL